MKVIRFILVMFFSVFCMFSLAGAIHEIIPSETAIPQPGPDADKLNEYIVRYVPYRMWNLWPGKGRLYKGKAPHGALLTTFVNDIAFFSIKNGTPMTDGAIIVKENYSVDRKFLGLTVMYKIKDYNPEKGNWFWAKYEPNGQASESGRIEKCIECHSLRKDKDHIFTGQNN